MNYFIVNNILVFYYQKLLNKYSWVVVEVATLVCATLVKANEGSSLLIEG